MISNELINLLQAMKKSDRIILYGAAKRAKYFLPVCMNIKSARDILVTVTELKTPMSFDEFEVKEIKDVNIASNDLVCVAAGENYWAEIDKILLEKGASQIVKLSEKLVMEAKLHSIFEQCKNVGIDLRLLFGVTVKEIYPMLHTGDDVSKNFVKSIKNRMWEIANEESMQYVMNHMLDAKEFSSRDEYHHWLVSYLQDNITESGINFEFGVASGISLSKLASYTKDVFYGFDSFEGLPEKWINGYEKKAFDYGGTLPPVPSNVELIAGWFDESLPRFIEEKIKGGGTGKINFIHIDCDLYSSTKTVFENLGKYIKSGTIIAFDEYFNYPGWKEHEYKAFREWSDKHHIEYEYLAYVENGFQVCIKIL